MEEGIGVANHGIGRGKEDMSFTRVRRAENLKRASGIREPEPADKIKKARLRTGTKRKQDRGIGRGEGRSHLAR